MVVETDRDEFAIKMKLEYNGFTLCFRVLLWGFLGCFFLVCFFFLVGKMRFPNLTTILLTESFSQWRIGQVVSFPDGKWAPLDIRQYGPQAMFV